MVKHNNIVPNIHCKKKYLSSSRGPLKVKLSLNKAGKKVSRRLKRAAKAARIAPRPLHRLRPVVHCPTQRYNSKVRLGRGFTLQELKEAGFSPRYARTVGIAVDHRRSNRSEESLNANVARLKEYKDKLLVFPKRSGRRRAGEVHCDETVETHVKGVVLPLMKPAAQIVTSKVTKELEKAQVYTDMRIARQETKVEGHRISVKNRAKDK